mmetsp:Transcript_27515/g.80313  ORF Transcript_27515/g.80313 Transcript_27515/m.80313 type:complete len:257 (+) Transcript_27515:3357-4127(+)
MICPPSSPPSPAPAGPSARLGRSIRCRDRPRAIVGLALRFETGSMDRVFLSCRFPALSPTDTFASPRPTPCAFSQPSSAAVASAAAPPSSTGPVSQPSDASVAVSTAAPPCRGVSRRDICCLEKSCLMPGSLLVRDAIRMRSPARLRACSRAASAAALRLVASIFLFTARCMSRCRSSIGRMVPSISRSRGRAVRRDWEAKASCSLLVCSSLSLSACSSRSASSGNTVLDSFSAAWAYLSAALAWSLACLADSKIF